MPHRNLRPWTAGYSEADCQLELPTTTVTSAVLIFFAIIIPTVSLISASLYWGLLYMLGFLTISCMVILVGPSVWPSDVARSLFIRFYKGALLQSTREKLPLKSSDALETTDHTIIERIVALNCTCSITDEDTDSELDSGYNSSSGLEKTVEEITEIYKTNRSSELRDVDLIVLASRGTIPLHSLENILGDPLRGVQIRRIVVYQKAGISIQKAQLPYKNYNYTDVIGRCAENVIGYIPLPVGVAGPLNIDGVDNYLPMATTEGTLIASTSRGCKVINAGGGVCTEVIGDSMTRAPVVSFENVRLAAAAKKYIESLEGQESLRKAFNSTTRFGALQKVAARMAGSSLYLRFSATTGDAMGMNMVGKGVDTALDALRHDHGFSHMNIVSLSGNYCTDKKSAAINWIEGRGKSVVAEAIIAPEIVQRILKCSVSELVKLNITKNLIGSALAGTASGGFNAHAANVVTAMFIATGQDPAQNVVSSNCITIMEELDDGSLRASVSMPSIEVGTIGGGTHLPAQAAMLDIIGVKSSAANPGENAKKLAQVIAGGVLAGELSLCAALVNRELVQSHMKYNRGSGP